MIRRQGLQNRKLAHQLSFGDTLNGHLKGVLLLEQSHLPVLVALVVFLACWQVMTVGMMLPSSMPMLSLLVHASHRQG